MAAISPSTMDFVLTASNDLERASSPVLESMLLRLRTERGSCFWDLDFGSTLGELARTTIGRDCLRDVENRARVALQPMVDEGAISSLSIAASRTDRNRVELALRCLDSSKAPVSFNLFVRVG